jgi:endonuclease/exonuclease/phosphatase family metal-dependent hydrolase
MPGRAGSRRDGAVFDGDEAGACVPSSWLVRIAIAVAALVATGCLQRGIPKDTRVEATYPAAATPREHGKKLRVVTFNVHSHSAKKILDGLKKDRYVRDFDIIMMQEVDRDDHVDGPTCSIACQMSKELGYYAMYAPGHAVPRGSCGVAVISRAPIVSSEVIELPYFDVHVNSGRRVALAVTVLLDNTPVTVYAVHLDNRLGVKQRKKQMLPVLEHARRKTTPIIMGGDFNTSPFTWFAHLIPMPTGTQDDNFEKLVRSYGLDTPVKESGATHQFLGMKLDAIYTRGLRTKLFAVGNGGYVSDHRPVWAVVELTPSASRTAATE